MNSELTYSLFHSDTVVSQNRLGTPHWAEGGGTLIHNKTLLTTCLKCLHVHKRCCIQHEFDKTLISLEILRSGGHLQLVRVNSFCVALPTTDWLFRLLNLQLKVKPTVCGTSRNMPTDNVLWPALDQVLVEICPVCSSLRQTTVLAGYTCSIRVCTNTGQRRGSPAQNLP